MADRFDQIFGASQGAPQPDRFDQVFGAPVNPQWTQGPLENPLEDDLKAVSTDPAGARRIQIEERNRSIVAKSRAKRAAQESDLSGDEVSAADPFAASKGAKDYAEHEPLAPSQEIKSGFGSGWDSTLATMRGNRADFAITVHGPTKELKDASAQAKAEAEAYQQQAPDGVLSGVAQNVGMIAASMFSTGKRAAEAGAAGAAIGATAGAAAGAPVGGVGAVPGAVGGAIVGGAAGLTAGFIADSYVVNSGQIMGDLQAAGVDGDTAKGFGMVGGSIMAALDMTGIGLVARPFVRQAEKKAVQEVITEELKTHLGNSAFRQAVKDYVVAGAGETLTETMQQIVQDVTTDLAKQSTGKDFKTIFNDPARRKQVIGNAVQTAVATAEGMAALGIPGAIVGGAKEHGAQEDLFGEPGAPPAPHQEAMGRGAGLVTPDDHASPLPTDLIQQGKGQAEIDLEHPGDTQLPEGGTVREFIEKGLGPQPVVEAPLETTPVVSHEKPLGVTQGRPSEALKAKIRSAESSGNDQAHSATSSASGRYQFTDATWAALGGDPAKKNNPAEQERLMDKLTDQNEHALTKAGVNATAGNLYLAHFLGAEGAIHALSDPNAAVDAKVQKANPFAEGWTNAQLAAWANRKMGGKPGEWTSNPNFAADRHWREQDKGADGFELTKHDSEIEFTEQALPEEEQAAAPAEPTSDDLAPIRDLAKSKGVELEVANRNDDDIMLQWIKRPARQKGVGREIMQALMDHADATDKTITLGITDNKGATKLQRYYEELGFERDDPSDDYDRIMTRHPEPQSSLKSTEAAPTPEHVAFAPETGTLGIPRAEMPQIKAEHRGAMVNFLNARGIEHQEETVPATSLKPSQAEYSPAKVEKALGFEGGDRAILVSQDGYVVDGHHQWLAAKEKGEDVRVIRLQAPIRKVLAEALNFPSSTLDEGAAANQPLISGQSAANNPASGEKPAQRPRDFVGVVKQHLADRTRKAGLRVRIDADDAISHGVPAESIYINAKAKHPVVKLRLQGVFATKKGSLNSQAQPAKIVSLDDLGDRIDPERFGRRADDTNRFAPEDVADMLRLSLERHDDALDRSDDRYESYAAEQEAAQHDPDGEHRTGIAEVAMAHGLELNDADVEEALAHVHAGESHEYAVEAALAQAAARIFEDATDVTGKDFYAEIASDLYEGEHAEPRGEGAGETLAGPEGAKGDEGRSAATEEKPAEAQPTKGSVAADKIETEAESKSAADELAPRPTDTRDHLQRKANEGLKPEKEQKPVGSDGGLFDTQDTTGNLFDPVEKAKAALTDALAALEGQKAEQESPAIPEPSPEERGLEPLFDEDNPEKQIGFHDPKTGAVELKDAGEKIGGARKDQWAQRGLTTADLEGMSRGEAHQFVTKDQVWPKPDYAKMVEDGAAPEAAAAAKLLRDSLAAKPKIDSDEGRTDYIEALQAAREVLDGIKTADDVRGIQQKLYDRLGLPQNSGYGYYGVNNTDEAKVARRKLFSIFKGRSASFSIDYKGRRKIEQMLADGWPTGKAEPWTRRYSVREANRAGTHEQYWFVTDKKWKIVSGEERFTTKEAAEAKAKELYEGLTKNEDGSKKAPVRPHLDKLERTGRDIRGGREIKPDDFLSDFGFRGVEYGNWVANDERQKATNLAYEGLHDLADTLGIPPETLSLGGQLGLAFGARGSGSAAAHYEPGKLVINLTKISGAGTLAHEWGHALDHYFGSLDGELGTRGAPDYASGGRSPYNFKALGNLRPELASAFDQVMDAIFKRDLPRAEVVRAIELNIEKVKAGIARQQERLDAAPKGNHPSNRKFIKDSREWIDYQQKRLKALGDRLAEARDESKPLTAQKVESSFYQSAQMLSGKSGAKGYWARPTELVARSFEAYVSDRIKDRGNVSQYLVHSVDENSFPAAIYGANPYPTGEERAKINAAFDKLFETVDVRGIPAPREGGPTKALYQAAPDVAGPFYSALEKAVDASQTKRAPAEQWLATLKRTPGVKQEELEWSGVEDWLKIQQGPVDKEALMGVLRDGGITVDEVVLGEDASSDAVNGLADEIGEEKADELELEGEQRQNWINSNWGSFEAIAEQRLGAERGTQFDNWSSDPSNDSYRELLITLPLGERGNPDRAPATHWDAEAVVAHARFMDKTDADGKRVLFIEEVQSDWHQKGRDQGYERKADDSEVAKAQDADRGALRDLTNARTAFVEAVDAIRAKATAANARGIWNYGENYLLDSMGYFVGSAIETEERAAKLLETLKGGAARGGWMSAVAEAEQLEDAMTRAELRWQETTQQLRNLQKGGIPEAPFKSTWPALVMKRMIRWAVDNGYEKVAWTTGAEQSARYNLAASVGGRIHISTQSDGRYNVSADNRSATEAIVRGGHGERSNSGAQMTEDQIKEVFGNDVANRLIAAAPPLGKGVGALDTDFEIGGEGMKAFYDRNLVNITNDIIKKYGAKVGPQRISQTLGQLTNMRGGRERLNEIVGGERPLQTNPGFEITDKMREAARSGFPLFQPGQSPFDRLAKMSEADKAAFRDDVLKWTKRLLPRDNVAVGFADLLLGPEGAKLSAGQYYRRLIEIAYHAPMRGWTLGHESIHAMKAMGLFTPTEWNLLVNRAWTPAMEKDVRKRWASYNLDEEGLKEEAVAELFGDHFQTFEAQAKGFVDRIARRILGVIASIAKALRKLRGADTSNIDAYHLMEQIRKGVIGSRPEGFGERSREGPPRTFGRKIEPKAQADGSAFLKWFGDSKVVDKNGAPLVVYHGTNADFSAFERTEDIGFHFGTKEQAEDRLGVLTQGLSSGRTVAAYLKIEKPLRLPDLGTWEPGNVIDALYDAGVISDAEVDETHEGVGQSIDRDWVKEKLAAKGYDGIIYHNSTEAIRPRTELEKLAIEVVPNEWVGKGAGPDKAFIARAPNVIGQAYGRTAAEARWNLMKKTRSGDLKVGDDSYIVFDSTQVKSTDNRGTFDPSDPRIMYQAAPGPMGIDESRPERLLAPARAVLDAFGSGNSDKIGDAIDHFRYIMQDRMLPVMRVQAAIERMLGRKLTDEENPYLAEELFYGRTGARLEQLQEEHVEPLFEDMRKAKITPDELETYLYARHAPERNKRIAEINPAFEAGTGSGMTDDEAAAIMQEVDDSGKRDALDALAARVDAMLDFSLQTRIESGLLSQAEADAWKATYQHYVPLRGLEEDGEAARISRQSGMSVKGKESRRAFGRKSKASDILAYSMLQAEEAITRAEQNEVAKAFLELAKAAPDPDFWRVDKVTRVPVFNKASGTVSYRSESRITAEDAPYTVSAKVDGIEHRITVNRSNESAARVASAMRNLDVQQFRFVVKTLGAVNRFMSKINTTYSPEFVISNAFRDLQTAGINLAGVDVKGIERKVLKDYPVALKAALKGAFGKESGEWGKWYREFKLEGGQTAFNETPNLDQLRARVAKSAKIKGRFGAKQLIGALVHSIEGVNDGVENALRLSTYKNARELGLSKKQAASLAKNVTVNFNRKGTAGPLVNSMYLFFNASAQGSVRILQAMKSPKVRRILYGTIVAGFFLQLLNSSWSDTDDDGEKFYDKISEFEKQRNLIVMLDRGKYIKIPMPWGYNVFPNMGRMLARMWQGEKPMLAMADWGSGVLDAFNPIGGAQSILDVISPTISDPLVDLMQNRDYAGRPIMPDEKQFGPQPPDNQRYWASVPAYDKWVTDKLNELTGGDDVRPGSIDMSPETLDFLQQTVLGSAGNFVRNLGAVAGKLTDPSQEFDANDIPFKRKLLGDKPKWYDKAAFYSRLAQVEQEVDYGKKYAKAGDREGLQKLFADEGDVLTLAKAAKAARKEMRGVGKVQRELKEAVAKGEVSDDEAKRISAALEARQTATINAFDRLYLSRVRQPIRP